MPQKLTFRKKLALELFRQYRKNTTKIHQLNYIFWEATLRCNLNCLHCGSDCKKEAVTKDMPVAYFIAAIDDIREIVEPNHTMIVFTCGEPILRKDLELCGKQLYERGFPWGIVSNGFQLTSERIELLLNAGMRAATISLDGMETSHNWLRGNKNSFKNAVSAIANLAKIHDFRFDVVTCANRKNIGELPELKKLLLELGVKEWRIFTIAPIGRAAQMNELQLPPEDFKQVFDFIAAERKTNDLKVNFGCEGFLGNYEGEVRDNLFFCRAGINVASVLSDGSISACPNLRENFIQGNIYSDSFRETWENKFRLHRDRSWAKTGQCAACEFFKYCEGNGLHFHSGANRELSICHYQKLQEAAN